MRRYVVEWMRKKDFQAISTGSDSVSFQLDGSRRRYGRFVTVHVKR